MAFWQSRKTLVTGGASFIGSHLVDRLLELGAAVRVADDLSSGDLDNLAGPLAAGDVELLEGDLRDQAFARKAVTHQWPPSVAQAHLNQLGQRVIG